MNVFELFATLSLDTSGYDEGIESSESKGASFLKTIGGGFAKVGATALKATAAGFVAAGTGITALTTQAVNAYGDFEQLTGGVEKLFGTSADKVMDYANVAYTSAGISANEYMETVTGFSAALIQGLGGDTEQAAELADIAIRDMSDNANVFGTDMASVMSAYQGFAKQNWTLLDNLKLGYGGTEAEMVRLMNDSGVLEKEITSMDEITFDQVIAGIHAIQEETNIAGTTANEAASTLQGSISSLKASWQNLVVGLADPNADLGVLIGNVVDSAKTALGNIIPVAEQALSGITDLIAGIAPIIAEELPALAERVLPSLLTAITSLMDTAVNVITTVLPTLISTLLPSLISAATSLITSLVKVLPTILGILKTALPQVLSMIIPAILTILPDIISAGIELIMALAQALSDNAVLIVEGVVSLVETITYTMLTPENLTQFVNVAVVLIETLATAILDNTPEILKLIPFIVASVVQAIAANGGQILFAIGDILASVGVSLIGGIFALFGMGKEEVANGLVEVGDVVWEGLTAIADFFTDFGTSVIDGAGIVWDGLTSLFSDGIEDAKTFVSDGLDSISKKFSDIWDGIKEAVGKGIDAVKSLFDFDWSLPDLKIPHFKITGGESPYGLGGKGKFPAIDIEWYKKAYEDAYMLSDATIFGSMSGNLIGGGENGNEMIMGEEYFRNVMADAASRMVIQPIVTVYVAGEEMDSYTVSAGQRIALVDGGRG